MLTDAQVQDILLSTKDAQRRRNLRLSELKKNYANRLRRKAEKYLDEWWENGVPLTVWNRLKNCEVVVAMKLHPAVSNEQEKVYLHSYSL